MGYGRFVFPFQLKDYLGNQHLLSVVIESQVMEEGMYDLRFSNISFMQLKVTTLMDLRARAMGRGTGRDQTAWSKGGAVAGVPAEAPMFTADDYSASDSFAEDTSVPSIHLKDFVGNTSTTNEKDTGDTWDPFAGDDASSSAPSSARAVDDAPPAIPARRPVVKSTTNTTSATTSTPPTLKPPGANPRSSLTGPIQPVTAPMDDPFSAPVSSSTTNNQPASAMDDFLGIGTSSGAGAQPAPSVTDDLASIFSAPSTTTATAPASSTIDVFSMPATTPNQASFAAAAPAPVVEDKKSDSIDVFGSGLVNLDNLTAPAASATASSTAHKPSLGEIAAQRNSVQAKNVMSAGINAAAGGISMTNLDYNLGMAGVPPVSAFPAQNNNMGMNMGMQQQGMGMQQQGMGMNVPAQANPANNAEYNPFDF